MTGLRPGPAPASLSWLKGALVVTSALILQIAVAADLPLGGAVGDVMLLVAVAAGLAGGADRGATYGFASGFVYDLMLDTPFGLSALTYALVGFTVGWIGAWLLRPAWWWPVVVAGAAGLVGVGLYVGVGHLVGEPYPYGDIARVGFVVGLWNAALAIPAVAVMRWVFGGRPVIEEPIRMTPPDRVGRKLRVGRRDWW